MSDETVLVGVLSTTGLLDAQAAALLAVDSDII